MEVELLEARQNSQKLVETCYEILAGKLMTTYATVKSSIQFHLDPGHVDTTTVAMTIA